MSNIIYYFTLAILLLKIWIPPSFANNNSDETNMVTQVSQQTLLNVADLDLNINQQSDLIFPNKLSQITLFNVRQTPKQADLKTLPIFIAIHGTPGSYTAWDALMHNKWIQQNSIFIAIDRPGWHNSSINIKNSSGELNSLVLPDIGDHSLIIAKFIQQIKEEFPNNKLIIIGHSWGASISAKIAADTVDLVDGVIALSGPFDANLTEPRWYHKLANTWVIGKIIGSNLRRSNDEMIHLNTILSKYANDWKNISEPILIVQGEDDFLVNLGNATFLQEEIKRQNSQVFLYELLDEGHFYPFKRPEKIIDAIESLPQDIQTDLFGKVVNG